MYDLSTGAAGLVIIEGNVTCAGSTGPLDSSGAVWGGTISGVAGGGVEGGVPNPWLLGHGGEEGGECQGSKVHVEDGFGVAVVVLKVRVVVPQGAHSQELCQGGLAAVELGWDHLGGLTQTSVFTGKGHL